MKQKYLQREKNRRNVIFYLCRKVWRNPTMQNVLELEKAFRSWVINISKNTEYASFEEAYSANKHFNYYTHLDDKNVSLERVLGDLEYLSDRFASEERINAMFKIIQHLKEKL